MTQNSIYDKIYTYANAPNEPKIEQLKSVYDNIKKVGMMFCELNIPNPTNRIFLLLTILIVSTNMK